VLLPFDIFLLVGSADKRRRYARFRLAMLGVIAALGVVGILKQPLLAALLWPAIPLAVVGLWPVTPARVDKAAGADPAALPGAKARRPPKRP